MKIRYFALGTLFFLFSFSSSLFAEISVKDELEKNVKQATSLDNVLQTYLEPKIIGKDANKAYLLESLNGDGEKKAVLSAVLLSNYAQKNSDVDLQKKINKKLLKLLADSKDAVVFNTAARLLAMSEDQEAIAPIKARLENVKSAKEKIELEISLFNLEP